ncbi:MAG TPA: ATP-binding protein [bacterium]|nr:ATP-binding protein [bacterium]
MKYIQRSIEKVLKKAAREFPVVVLTGPRQAGKTTVLKHLYEKSHRYISLELPDVRAAASDDPRGFIEMYPPPVVFDEVQHAPDLLPYIKERVDADRNTAGQYILTGSQNILLAQNITETLAGRSAVLRLFPMTYHEQAGVPGHPLPWEKGKRSDRKKVPLNTLWRNILLGGYPELVAGGKRDLPLWHGSYIQTYLERDVRTLRQVGDLTQFQMFLRALAARSAQLLNLTEIARDIGVAVNTVKSWLSVLEASYQVIILRPYFENIGKRLVKSPKVYFTDTGTLCYIVGLKDPEHARKGPMGGAIMETAVVSDIYRTLMHRGETPQMYFWRTSSGTEVDVVIDEGNRLIPIEIKSSATPNRNMAKGIETFREDFGEKASKGYLICPCDAPLPLGPDASSWPIYDL